MGIKKKALVRTSFSAQTPEFYNYLDLAREISTE
jgi:hypothetical protein